MRGGKRENAGRKGFGPSKAYWLPIAMESEINAMLEKYKATYTEKHAFDSLKKSKDPVKTRIPILSEEQVKTFQQWLIRHRFAKSFTEARKLTKTPALQRETFLKYIHSVNESTVLEIEDISDLYVVD